MCAGARTSVSSRLSANSSDHSGRSRKRSSASRLPFLSVFLVWFLELICAACVELFRHFAPMLDLKMNLTIPVVAMQRTNCFQNLWITMEREEVRIVCFAESTLPVLGQPWLLTADPLTGVSVVFAQLAKR